MDPQLKQSLGFILGEIFRLQSHLNMKVPSDAAIYGLTHGVEFMIDGIVRRKGDLVPSEAVRNVITVLATYEDDPERELVGYFDIEPRLDALGIDRTAAVRILTFLKAAGLFPGTFTRLNNENSPPECRTFDEIEGRYSITPHMKIKKQRPL